MGRRGAHRPVGALAVLLAAGLLAGACSAPRDEPVAARSAEPSGRADPGSSGVAGRAAAGEEQQFYVVVFRDYPDLSRVASVDDPADRGRELVRSLRTTSDRSQARARELLDAAGIGYRELWLANALAICTCDRDAVDRLRGLDEVDTVIGGPDARIDTADDEPVFPGVAPSASPALDALGVSALRARPGAPDGTGVTIGVIDTGVDATHPALAAGYRGAAETGGRAPSHDRNWFDPYGRCRTPCDPQGHGTHVTSVAVGRAVAGTEPSGGGAGGWAGGATTSAVPALGVAPGARWIAARGCTGAVCDLDELLAAMQFMVAPTDRAGRDPRPDLRPDVLVSSWGLTRRNPALERAQRAVEAAGIVPVAAAGNHGPACGSVTTPGSHDTTLTAGALGLDRRPLAASGRGSDPDEIQPNVAAVGEAVPGALPGGTWGTMTGTSQAAPQVAGLAALLLQVRPDLRGRFGEVERRIDDAATAVPDDSCGVDPDAPSVNNVTGAGLPDAVRLVDAAAG